MGGGRLEAGGGSNQPFSNDVLCIISIQLNYKQQQIFFIPIHQTKLLYRSACSITFQLQFFDINNYFDQTSKVMSGTKSL